MASDLSRRGALTLSAGLAAGLLVPGTATAKPPPGKGKPPRIRTANISDKALGVDVRTINITVGPPGEAGFPDETNTGVPAGTSLTAYSGPSNITTNGTTVDSKTITSCITINATNVTFTKCLFQSGGCFWNVLSENEDAGLQLIDCEVDGLDNTSADSCVSGSGYSLLRCNIHGTPDGIKAGWNCVIQDRYIHDLALPEVDPHADGIQSLGTGSLTISHNTIIGEVGWTSCIILSTGSAPQMENISITNNLFAGGAYCVYGGYQSGVDDPAKTNNISITNNWFSTQVFSTGGAFGPLASVDAPEVVHTGNKWYDGPNAGLSVD